MERVFFILSVVGIAYLSFVVFLTSGKREINERFRKQLTLQHVRQRLQSDKLQTLLADAGVQTTSGNVNLFRFGATGLYLGVQLTIDFIRGNPLNPLDILIAVGILLATSSAKYAPLGAMLRRIHKSKIMKKDGELISFLRLYENNRMKKRGHTEFGAYCVEVAIHFQYIRQDLYQLTEYAVEEGTEKAINWFCGQFPEDHHFIADFRSILLSTESMEDDEEVLTYLNMQSKIISKISADHYQWKWSNIGSISTFVTLVPSVTTFIMIVSLSLMYVMLIKNQFNGVSLYQ